MTLRNARRTPIPSQRASPSAPRSPVSGVEFPPQANRNVRFGPLKAVPGHIEA